MIKMAKITDLGECSEDDKYELLDAVAHYNIANRTVIRERKRILELTRKNKANVAFE